jgi:hypothetical protein
MPMRSHPLWQRLACVVLLVATHIGLAGSVDASQESARIRDVGEWLWNLRDGEIANAMYRYENLIVSGDLFVQQYRDVLAAVKPALRDDEGMSLIRTLQNPKDANFGFVTVQTVFTWDRERGLTIYLERVPSGFRVVGESFWIA